jgi:ubiquinone/menaquinone biosynthesis C-methylase UbiE
LTTRRSQVYSHGYGDHHLRVLSARRAVDHVAFLLPHLRRGMRLLDCGCGPGSVTLDLAEIVAPAKVVGIDIEPKQVALATAAAARRKLRNARFQVGNVHALPFDAGSFDVVVANGVLEHVRQPLRALKEIRRVLAPGGLVAIRDVDRGSMHIWPCSPLLRDYWQLHLRIFAQNGASPAYAPSQRALLQKAGFTDTEASATVEFFGTSEDTRGLARGIVRQLLEPTFGGVALDEGLVDDKTLRAMARACLAWGRRPDALAFYTWCQAIGRAP